MVIDQVDDDVSRAARPRRPERSGGRRPRSRWRSRTATVLVAFVAAVTLLVGPTTTQDAAQAYQGPVVGVGSLSLPSVAVRAAPLLFSPVGAAIFAIGVGAFFLLDGDDAVGEWTDDAVCWLFGGDGCAPTTGTGSPTQHFIIPDPRTTTTLSFGQGGGTHTLMMTGNECKDHKPPINGVTYCESQGPTYIPGHTTMIVDCKDPAGLVRQSGPIQPATASSSGAGSEGGAWSVQQLDNGIEGAVCPVGYSVVRAKWWGAQTSSSLQVNPGEWSSGSGLGPNRVKVRIDTTCTRPDGSTYVVTGPETTGANGTAGSCNPGDVATGTEVFSRTGPNDPWTSKGRVDVGGAQTRTDYRECLTPQGQTTCATVVQVDGADCVVGRTDCFDWQQTAEQSPSRVGCRWGPYSMPLSACEPLAHMYKTGTVTRDRTGTWAPAGPDGQPLPEPWTNPNPAPNPNPTTPEAPPGGDPNSPEPAPDPDGESGNCWAGMISWNPVDWVTTPVKCALVWAFVPGQGYMAQQMGAVQKTWNGTIVGTWVTSISDVAGTVSRGPGGGSGCLGPPLTGDLSSLLSTGAGYTMYPFSTCNEPMRTVAMIVSAALTVGVWLGAAFFCVKVVAGAIGLDLGSWGRSRTDDDT